MKNERYTEQARQSRLTSLLHTPHPFSDTIYTIHNNTSRWLYRQIIKQVIGITNTSENEERGAEPWNNSNPIPFGNRNCRICTRTLESAYRGTLLNSGDGSTRFGKLQSKVVRREGRGNELPLTKVKVKYAEMMVSLHRDQGDLDPCMRHSEGYLQLQRVCVCVCVKHGTSFMRYY